MSNFRRFGLLPFFKSDQPQDWEIDGYYYNWRKTVQYVPRDTLVSFRTPVISGSKAVPTEITIRKLKIKGQTKTIVSSDTYTVDIYKEELLGGTESYYYFFQSPIDASPVNYLEAGEMYEIYLDNGVGDTFISNIFIALDIEDVYIKSEAGETITDETGEGILFE